MKSSVDQQVARLAWDSDHFGMEVGRIASPDLDDADLADCLRQARAAGLELVYWTTADGRIPGKTLLEHFGGQLVDRRVTYAVTVASLPERGPPASWQFRIEEYARGPASSALLSLAVQSGVRSRYRVDARFPPHLFRNLYEIWMERSTRQEIADVVLTAIDPRNTIVGLLTLGVAESEGRIGLVGVDESRRRLGIARQLIHAGHRWVAARAIQTVSVATQGDNREACAFYERCGYQVRDRTNVFHFWPQQTASSP